MSKKVFVDWHLSKYFLAVLVLFPSFTYFPFFLFTFNTMQLNDCFLVLAFISDGSVLLNKFSPSFPLSARSLSTIFLRRFAFVQYTKSPYSSLFCLLSIYLVVFFFNFTSYFMVVVLVKCKKREFIFKHLFPMKSSPRT